MQFVVHFQINLFYTVTTLSVSDWRFMFLISSINSYKSVLQVTTVWE